MLRPDTLALTALLSLLTALGPLSTDMYLPSLPDIATAYGASNAAVQLTLASFLAGMALGQIVYGPISDRYGRRPTLMGALALFCAASLACLVAPRIEVLIGLRFLQACGGSGAIVLARAIVRDLYAGARAGRELSLMGMIMGLAPIVAPLIGGGLQASFGWQASFWVLTAFGLLAAAVTWPLLPETMPQRVHVPLSVSAIAADYRMLIVHPSVAAHIGLLALTYSGLFAWIASASFVLQQIYGLSAAGFGIAFAISSAGYMLGTSIATRVVGRIGLGPTMGYGAAATAVAGSTMVCGLVLGLGSPASLVAPMALYAAGLGMVLPQSIAGALTPFPQRAGTASSLAGFIQQGSGALLGIGLMTGLGATAWPLAIVIALIGWGTLLLWVGTRRIRQG